MQRQNWFQNLILYVLMHLNYSEYHLCNISITYFTTDDYKVTNQPKRHLNILTAYLSTLEILQCYGSWHFTTWSNWTKNMILDHYISKTLNISTKPINLINILIVCVLNKLNPTSVKLLLYFYIGLKVER